MNPSGFGIFVEVGCEDSGGGEVVGSSPVAPTGSVHPENNVQ